MINAPSRAPPLTLYSPDYPSSSIRSFTLYDPDLHFGPDVGVQADRDRENAECLDRLIQHDRALVDLVIQVLLVEAVGDVAGSDRAEQLAFFTGIRVEREGNALELRGAPTRFQEFALGFLLAAFLILFELAHVRRGCFEREIAREQKVAGKTRLDRHQVTGCAEILEVLPQDYFQVFHCRSSISVTMAERFGQHVFSGPARYHSSPISTSRP